jgi:hypothetical protein
MKAMPPPKADSQLTASARESLAHGFGYQEKVEDVGSKLLAS